MMNSGKILFEENTLFRTLPNGLEIYVFPRHGCGNVRAMTVVRTGSMHEGQFLGCGLSHFLEHMVFSGTEWFPGFTEITDKVNAAGGSLNASTGHGVTRYYIDVPAPAAKEALRMLFSMVAMPLFPEERFVHERGAILRECAMCRDNPVNALFNTVLESVFQYHPIRVPIIGYEEKIAMVSREQMSEYYHLRYSPVRTAFIVVGDVDAEEIADYIQSIAGTWQMGRIDEPVLPSELPRGYKTVKDTVFNDAILRCAYTYPLVGTITKEQRYAMSVLNIIAVNSASSRFELALRTNDDIALSYAYTGFSVKDLKEKSYMVFAKPENAELLDNAIHEVFRKLKEEPVSQAEIDRIAICAERDDWDIFRKNSKIAELLSKVFQNREPLSVLDERRELMMKVSPDDVQSAARMLFDFNNENVVRQFPASFRKPRKITGITMHKPDLPIVRTLPGGQRIFALKDLNSPVIRFAFVFPCDASTLTSEQVCLDNLMVNVWERATKKWKEEELLALLDENALDFSISAESNNILLEADCLESRLPILMDILKSLLSEPAFLPEHFEQERSEMIKVIESEMKNPREVGLSKMREALFGEDNPRGIPLEEYIPKINAYTLQDLRDLHSRIFVPTWTVAGISSNMPTENAEKILADILSVIPWSQTPISIQPAPVYQKGGKVVSTFVDKNQTCVFYGFPGPVLKEYSTAVKLVINACNGMASPLFKSIREDRGLAYYTGLSIDAFLNCGAVYFYAGTEEKSVHEVCSLFEKERLNRIENGITPEEFEAEKLGMITAIRQDMLDMEKLLPLCAKREFTGIGAAKAWERIGELENLTLQEVNQAAKQFFQAETFVTSIVFPEQK